MDLGAGNKLYRKTSVSKGNGQNASKKYDAGQKIISSDKNLSSRTLPRSMPKPLPLFSHSPQAQNPNWNLHHNDVGILHSSYVNVGPKNTAFAGPIYAGIPDYHYYLPTNIGRYSIPGSGKVYGEPLRMSHYDHLPSYEEAISDGNPTTHNVSDSKLTTDGLVKTLALFNGQFGTAETLSRQVGVHPEIIVNLSKSRKDLFAVMEDGEEAVVELVPKLSLCPMYHTSNGCTEKKNCSKLHICKAYALRECRAQSCVYGHKWDTTHNDTILSKLYLDLIDHGVLHQIVQKVCSDISQVQICFYYNNDKGCRAEYCKFLHICKKYIVGKGRCSEKKCTLNHNLLAPSCRNLFQNLGVPANEKPQDLLKRVAIHEAEQPFRSRMRKNREVEEVLTKSEQDGKSAQVERSLSVSDTSESSEEVSEHAKNTKKQHLDSSRKRIKTVKFSDVLGNVENLEICLFAIDDRCRNAKKGCKYLHAKSLFHWQFKNDSNWYNFRVFHSKILEKAYRDVLKVEVELPALDQSKVENEARELYDILGASPWKADFQSMTISCNKLQQKIRRVSTRSSVLSSSPKATVFEWYFQDEQGNWIVYGHVDSLGKQNFVCNVTSADIEKKYLSDPKSGFVISSAHYSYKLDFLNMIQMNMSTKKEREIRRRPSRLAYHNKQTSKYDSCGAIPAHWNTVQDNQTHLLVPLDHSSSEYQEVSSRLRLTLPTACIQMIQRLQNPYLWRLFQYKKLSLSQRYDDFQMNLQKLFHGTDPKNIDTVCKENFDWRQGISHEQSYGQGTYFSNSAATARHHCVPNKYGRVTVFLAHVIIGSIVKGNPTMTRPPCNPSVNALYDTTVDDVESPT
ncbi:hypothetical protein SK128_025370, partial [Halocaridina rubra]